MLRQELAGRVQLTTFVTAGPEAATVASVRSSRKQLQALYQRVAADGRDVIVHCELSAGTLEPFWSVARNDWTISATVHDPPHLVWWPLATSAISKRASLKHGIHYPFRRQFWKLEDRLFEDAQFIALSATGASSLTDRGLRCSELAHFIAQPLAEVRPLSERPVSVGLFGYNYGGKGFELISDIRAALPEHIAMNVAGRGTESLIPERGVTYLGALDAEGMAEFFTRMRVLILPYEPGGRYGDFTSASGALAWARTYGTAVVSTSVRAMPEEAAAGAVRLAKRDGVSIAHAVTSIIDSSGFLLKADADLEQLRRSRRVSTVAEAMVDIWTQLRTVS